ncbi:Glutamine amidotransferase type-2 domain-containing protein [Candidatus Hydrogenisulfobacillus filiaventi]|uniref:Glutamine amidotransferase type-2 domain-containing protein n=1 Tax=Candidatus Hydrogenisulfobacillus filiaventi TaxID=2707344 RepID=A0A6F8ZD93_9FIRM|nr:Glutamine amidotransferase type-2 domain-containing protein [Candidatus Hydrogenisulfobacillus filiaventi]
MDPALSPRLASWVHRYIGQERDACALFGIVRKEATAADQESPWQLAVEALTAMDHRAGWVDGKSDGTGILADIPVAAWNARLQTAGLEPVAGSERFWLLTTVTPIGERRAMNEALTGVLAAFGFRLLLSHTELGDGRDLLEAHALLYEGTGSLPERTRFALLEELERAFPGRIASLSRRYTVLKVTNGPQRLAEILRANWGESYLPRAVIGHNRFSTNTTTELSRVQPFVNLAHNGEIDTIDQLEREMVAFGIEAIPSGSDSQNLDRVVSALAWQEGLSPAEAVRLAVAPSPALIDRLPAAGRAAWRYLEALWGPWAQGPAGVLVLEGNSLVAAVDAMGLRPLWLLETAEAFILASEPGVVPSGRWVAEPRSIGPGELLALEWEDGGPVRVVEGEEVFRRLAARIPDTVIPEVSLPPATEPGPEVPAWRYVADGWHKDDQTLVQTWAREGKEPIGSLGFDGPLAALSEGLANLSDYLQETVAVVTNPALDRERESEHFRLEQYVGRRPSWDRPWVPGDGLWLKRPWLDHAGLEALIARFAPRVARFPLLWDPAVDEITTAERLAEAVLEALENSEVRLVVLSDEGAYRSPQGPAALDPALAVATLDRRLRNTRRRRDVGVVVESGMIRNLHDIMVLLGLGAEAVVPSLLWALVPPERRTVVSDVLASGAEKVLSTMGIHELEGYGHVFSAIGLPEAMARALGVVSFAAPAAMDAFLVRRADEARTRLACFGQEQLKPTAIPRATGHVHRAAQELAEGTISGLEYRQRTREWEARHPIALRHTLGFRNLRGGRHSGGTVDLSMGEHDLPFVISSMSFGSQGETAFRAYAEAARILNMLAMNGEGGEIPDMVGRYYRWRGHQIASGRFGINTAMINGAAYAEIKIGQGAKPGEGGHLPGTKVSVKVAQARKAVPGIDLISPSNNHDLYSIEDLQELIDELKEAHPGLKVVVKVPVVPNIGTIAVGIVKAGADVVNLSGFDGGTGAARMHALRHVGLPADIGVPVVHAALTLAGLRNRAEIWADGGMRSADDVLRMILLGANRVGFGTLAMVALGCTVCRRCQTDTCHVGIATQIESLEEARERGLRKFQPQELDRAVTHLVRFFSGLGDALAENLRELGITRLADAVGQSQYLVQERFREQVAYEDFIAQSALAVNEAQSSEAVVGLAEGAPLGAPLKPATRFSSRTRLIGTGPSGQKVRQNDPGLLTLPRVQHVAGQGFGAFLSEGVTLIAEGGAQDGVGKSASGGTIAVMKSRGAHGRWLGGHVGKSLGYGAQGGTLIVQGTADARAGIRLAGADVIIAGDDIDRVPAAPDDWRGTLIRGFGFEYMTRGRALVLGDPGPWLAAGMTGGVLYLMVDPARGLTVDHLRSRLAANAKVSLRPIDSEDLTAIQELAGKLAEAYRNTGQDHRVPALEALVADARRHFWKVVPGLAQTDQTEATE